VSRAPTIKDIAAIELRAKIRSRSLAMDVVEASLYYTASHAYVLLAAAIGEKLDGTLPVVEFALAVSLEVAQQVSPSNADAVLKTVLFHVGMVHKFATELQRLTDERDEAREALRELLSKKLKPRKHRGVAYAKRRSSRTDAGG
jgi:hypothetical protein